MGILVRPVHRGCLDVSPRLGVFLMAFTDNTASGWCADADGSGNFTNWRSAANPSTCADATTGTGTWWFLKLPDAKALEAAYSSTAASSPQSPVSPFPLASLTLDQANQLGWMSLAPIITAYLLRKFRDVLQ